MRKLVHPLLIGAVAIVAIGAAALAQPAGQGGQGGKSTPIVAKHFSHADHKARGIAVDKCERCHAVDAAGQVLAPAAQGHAPCLDAKCHATDFLAVGEKAKRANPAQFAKSSAICLGCHASVPWPWKKAPTRILKAYEGSREHHVEMNHFEHTVRAKAAGCRGCHTVDAKSFALTAGTPGHAQCATCHNARDFKDFTMKQCGNCHLAESREAALRRLSITESRPKTDVRACATEGHAQLEAKLGKKVPCFKHERVEHRTLNGKPVQCASCHYVVADKTKWAARRYQTLADLLANPIIWNAEDEQHESCGRIAACHKRDVDAVSGAKCNLCHAEKSVY